MRWWWSRPRGVDAVDDAEQVVRRASGTAFCVSTASPSRHGVRQARWFGSPPARTRQRAARAGEAERAARAVVLRAARRRAGARRRGARRRRARRAAPGSAVAVEEDRAVGVEASVGGAWRSGGGGGGYRRPGRRLAMRGRATARRPARHTRVMTCAWRSCSSSSTASAPGARTPSANPLARARAPPRRASPTGPARRCPRAAARCSPTRASASPAARSRRPGQTTILTGENAPAHVGRHLWGSRTRRCASSSAARSLFRALAAAGRSRRLRERVPGRVPARARARRGGRAGVRARPPPRRAPRPRRSRSPRAAFRFRTWADAARGRGAHARPHRRARARAYGADAAAARAREAAAEVLLGARGGSRTSRSFEFFETDEAGHARSMDGALDALCRLDAFLRALVAGLRPGDALVVASDHGNVEDLSIRNHTRAPVPVLGFGRAAERARRGAGPHRSRAAPARARGRAAPCPRPARLARRPALRPPDDARHEPEPVAVRALRAHPEPHRLAVDRPPSRRTRGPTPTRARPRRRRRAARRARAEQRERRRASGPPARRRPPRRASRARRDRPRRARPRRASPSSREATSGSVRSTLRSRRRSASRPIGVAHGAQPAPRERVERGARAGTSRMASSVGSGEGNGSRRHPRRAAPAPRARPFGLGPGRGQDRAPLARRATRCSSISPTSAAGATVDTGT